EDELAAALARRPHRLTLDVAADAAARDHTVLERHTAEGDHDLGLLDDLLPGHVPATDTLQRTEDMRKQHCRSAGAVTIDGADIPAERRVQEPVQLALRMVEAPGARPAIGAAEDRAGTVGIAHPRELTRQEIEHAVPRHRHEFVTAASIVGARTALEP